MVPERKEATIVQRRAANPKQLAVWSLAGAFLAASGFFTTLAPRGHGGWLWAFIPQTVAGFALYMILESRLTRLYRAGVWTEGELAPVRAMLQHPAWMWVMGSIFAAAVLTALSTHHRMGLIYLGVLPMQALGHMKTALMPPVKKSGGLADWASSKPLYSEHWGEARRGDVLSS